MFPSIWMQLVPHSFKHSSTPPAKHLHSLTRKRFVVVEIFIEISIYSIKAIINSRNFFLGNKESRSLEQRHLTLQKFLAESYCSIYRSAMVWILGVFHWINRSVNLDNYLRSKFASMFFKYGIRNLRRSDTNGFFVILLKDTQWYHKATYTNIWKTSEQSKSWNNCWNK